MSFLDDINDILKSLKEGQLNEVEAETSLRQFLQNSEPKNLLQLGKFNVNIAEGKDIHIGDRTYHGVDAEKIKEIFHNILKEFKPPVVEFTVDWRKVCENALKERQQRLTTNPLTTGDGVEFAFDDIYVPLGLVEKVKKDQRSGEISPESGSQMFQPEEVTLTYKNDEFFAQVLREQKSPKSNGRRLAITGEPGAGKSTLLQKIAQWVTEETEQDVAIWVSLADLQGQTLENYLLQKWLKDVLEEVEVTLEMKKALALLFKSGQVWLLLDGADEMGGNPLIELANQITGWVAQARVVVTCRQNVWDAGKNALEGFDVYRNLDFDYPEGMGQFIHRWFAKTPELGERLLVELAQTGKERIRDTVRNPLRLALLCRAWQVRQGKLPETKAGLYKQFTDALYEWKSDNKKFDINEDDQEKLNIALSKLALRGMEQSESRFRLKESLLREILGKKDRHLFSLALQLGWLNLVGVAVENPNESVYAFYHPTFQEYFAALAVDDWSYFLHHVPDNPSLGTYRIFEKQWKEVILLWFGRENVEKEAFIKKLGNFDDGCGIWNYPKVDRGFYEYQAYFFAGIVISEFKESYFADEIVSQIVSQIVKWSCNYLYPIALRARAILLETDKQKQTVINHLIIMLEQNYDNIPETVIYSLANIAVENDKVINYLIQLLDKTCDESTNLRIIESLANIAIGNDGAINRLIQLLEKTCDEPTHLRIAYSLGKIAVGNDRAINCLIQLLEKTCDELTHKTIERSLSNIAVRNENAINNLINLLNRTSDESIHRRVSYILGNIAVGNDTVVDRLIKLFNQTSEELTHQVIANSLSNIAVGNENVINYLIHQLLNKTSDQCTCQAVANSLSNIAVGNENAINYLIHQLLNKTSDKSIHHDIVNILIRIAVGNDNAINELIQTLNKTSDESIYRTISCILGHIAVGNEKVINRLINLFDEATEESTYQRLANSLSNIAEGNENAINHLIKLLHKTSNESTYLQVAYSLGKIAVGNENAINSLIELLDKTSNESTHRIIVKSLGNIAVGHKEVINLLIDLLKGTSDEFTLQAIIESLGNIAVGNEEVISLLVSMFQETFDEYTNQYIVNILGRIAIGNENAIYNLIDLLNKTSDESIHRKVSYILNNIAVGNEKFVNRFIRLFNQTSNEDTLLCIGNILGNIVLTKENTEAIIAIKNNLTDEIYKNQFSLYEKSYTLIWQWSQNLSYPDFYMIWYKNLTRTDIGITDQISVGNIILTEYPQTKTNILYQLQPTLQTYLLPINIQSLLEETDSSIICQELCTLIYSHSLPDADIPTVKNFAQLKQQIFTAKKQLQKRHLALIFYECDPHPPLLTCCQKIVNPQIGLHILWITNEPLEAPLQGFSPNQNNLLGVVQSYINEIA